MVTYPRSSTTINLDHFLIKIELARKVRLAMAPAKRVNQVSQVLAQLDRRLHSTTFKNDIAAHELSDKIRHFQPVT